LFDRPKRGFGVPVGPWLRGPLRPWAEALLDERGLREDGLLDAGRVRAIWAQHVARERDRAQLLWHLLMFQAWRECWRTPGRVPGRGGAALAVAVGSAA
jgi:asparagine synthase (glutamine-hydrolysing)